MNIFGVIQSTKFDEVKVNICKCEHGKHPT
jgi:hypothetical protein